MARHGMSDSGWNFVKHLFPGVEKPRVGRPWIEHRKVLDGIFWILRAGAPWRDLPEEFGPWETVYGRYRRWTRDGTFDALLDEIIVLINDRGDIDWDLWCVDGTIIRAARCAGGAPKKTPCRTSRKTMPWAAQREVLLPKSM